MVECTRRPYCSTRYILDTSSRQKGHWRSIHHWHHHTPIAQAEKLSLSGSSFTVRFPASAGTLYYDPTLELVLTPGEREGFWRHTWFVWAASVLGVSVSVFVNSYAGVYACCSTRMYTPLTTCFKVLGNNRTKTMHLTASGSYFCFCAFFFFSQAYFPAGCVMGGQLWSPMSQT